MAFVTQIGAIEISGQDAHARSYCQETLRFRNGRDAAARRRLHRRTARASTATGCSAKGLTASISRRPSRFLPSGSAARVEAWRQDGTRTTSPILGLVAAARVGVGAAMLLGAGQVLQARIGNRDAADADDRDSRPGPRIRRLRSPGLRGGGEFRRWAAAGLVSDNADLLLGLRSRPLVGTKSALIAILAPVPFIGAAVLGFVRSLRKGQRSLSRWRYAGPRRCRPWFRTDPDR